MLAVFLDFDGVINRGSGRWVSALVTQLNRITDRTGAKILIHSSWRWGRTLDDSPDLGHFVGTPEFIQTRQNIGLTPEQADQAIQHLKGVTW